MAKVTLKCFDSSGKEAAAQSVSSDIFDVEVERSLFHDVVRWQRAKLRAGTHSVKTRSQVRGGGAKPFRQKGTGRARAGSSRSPLWVGGGVAHGPKTKSYEFSLNKKVRKKAICGILTARRTEDKCFVVKDFGLDAPKTKQAASLLASVGVENGRRTLVVVDSAETATQMSLRNLPGVRVVSAGGLNVYDAMKSEILIFTGTGLSSTEARLLGTETVAA
ncbi:UNVERIFIED_CONTAM: hypothetical protein GTU68_043635 [Idotea baltica]|nr:hypothetical protein [Idotea baltica]